MSKKNKVTKKVTKKVPKKPVKKPKKEVEVLEDDYKPPRSYKIMGYCPKCDMVLSDKDFVSKMVFECPCGCRKHKKYIKAESKIEKKRKKLAKQSKKQYLKEASVASKHIESGSSSSTHTSNLPDVAIMGKVQD